jgi:hypothetical protein
LIQSGSQELSGAFLGSPVPRARVFEVRVPLQDFPNGMERIVLITQDAVRPVDIGMNSDTRMLGPRCPGNDVDTIALSQSEPLERLRYL